MIRITFHLSQCLSTFPLLRKIKSRQSFEEMGKGQSGDGGTVSRDEETICMDQTKTGAEETK